MKYYNIKTNIIHRQKKENERENELFSLCFVLVGTRFLFNSNQKTFSK